MMNHGLLAPQFGLLGRSLEDAKPFDTPASAAPTVIVKRRRTLSVVTPTDTGEPAAKVAEPAVKEARVFRLDTSSPSEQPTATAVAPVEHVQATPNTEVSAPQSPAHPPRLRRRRDPVRKPTLLSHIVYESPGVSDSPLTAADTESTSFDHDARTHEPPVSLKDVEAAMARLNETLASAAVARRISDDLAAFLQGRVAPQKRGND
jgi:hypothetical protein